MKSDKTISEWATPLHVAPALASGALASGAPVDTYKTIGGER